MSLAARNAARSASASPTAGSGSPLRTATPVVIVPRSAAEPATTWPALVSSAISAEVRISRSALAPPISLSRMAPTAPKVPSMSVPVSALNCGVSAATKPFAAPPERMASFMSSELLVHAVVEELLRPPLHALRRDDAKAAMLEERARRDARLGEQPQQAARVRARLDGAQQPAGDAGALMIGMHVEHIDQPIARHVDEADRRAVEVGHPHGLVVEPIGPSTRVDLVRRPRHDLLRRVIATVDPPHRVAKQRDHAGEIARPIATDVDRHGGAPSRYIHAIRAKAMA